LEEQGNFIIDVNPEGMQHLEEKAKEKGWQLFKIFLHAPERERHNRMLNREFGSKELVDYSDKEWSTVTKKIGNDSNPQEPYKEGKADLVLENMDLNEVKAAIKAGVLNFLEHKELSEKSLELRPSERSLESTKRF
jgi:hypothetical protein